jgi:NSS family neurotransmitter:Na+ symporter
MCYEYGKGTFLIPYIIGLLVMGIPWFLAELGMGHIMQRGAPGSFAKVGKKWEWAGWWPVFVSFFLNTYYVMIISWAVCYMGFSLFLSWEVAGATLTEAPTQFFYEDFLGKTGGPFEFGSFNFLAIGGSLLTWAAIFFILHRGVRRVSKVVYFTVLIPWLLLVVLAVRGLTLPGAVDGLNDYLTPDLSALGDASIWVAAFGQVAFTLSLGQGIMYAYGSYLPKKSDVTNNALITAFADSGTAFFAGLAIFSVIGFMMYSEAVPPEMGGLGLAFQTYPVAVSLMPFGQRIIGFIFFLCLWFLGIDSAFSITEAMTTAITDKWTISKSKATGIVCTFGFLIGLIYATGAGIYWLGMVDRSVSFIGLILTGVVTMIVVGWVFGADKVREHLNSVSTVKVGWWFDWLIKVAVPVLALVAIIPQLVAEITGKGAVWGIRVTEEVLSFDLTAELIGFWGLIVMPIILAAVFSFIKCSKEV